MALADRKIPWVGPGCIEPKTPPEPLTETSAYHPVFLAGGNRCAHGESYYCLRCGAEVPPDWTLPEGVA